MTVARSVPGPARSACRLRFLVRHTGQNALFRKMRFSLPGQTWRRLTEKRILQPAPHGKAHSARPIACRVPLLVRPTRRMRLSVTLRRPGSVGQPPRQAAGHYGECLNWANALEQPPASLRGGLCQGPQISVRSLASRKGALCPTGGLQNALFREGPHAKCAFPWRRRHRLRFSVRVRVQNALLRRVRFSSPAQTWSHLTKKRSLKPAGRAECAFP